MAAPPPVRPGFNQGIGGLCGLAHDIGQRCDPGRRHDFGQGQNRRQALFQSFADRPARLRRLGTGPVIAGQMAAEAGDHGPVDPAFGQGTAGQRIIGKAAHDDDRLQPLARAVEAQATVRRPGNMGDAEIEFRGHRPVQRQFRGTGPLPRSQCGEIEIAKVNRTLDLVSPVARQKHAGARRIDPGHRGAVAGLGLKEGDGLDLVQVQGIRLPKLAGH